MTSNDYARLILTAIEQPCASLPDLLFDENKRNNAARVMSRLLCHRLTLKDSALQLRHHTSYEWRGGIINIRNARITDHHWSSLVPSTIEELHELSQKTPVAYVLTYWAIDEATLHVWVLPEELVYPSLSQLPVGAKFGRKTVEIFPAEHRIIGCDNSPDLQSFYAKVALPPEEVSKLIEAIKLDDAAKQIANPRDDDDGPGPLFENEENEESNSCYTSSTIEYLRELPDHVDDGEWHEENKRRYEQVLRDPTRELVDQIGTRFIQPLNPEIAGGKRKLSILKKNDWGKGGYYDHYWFAFYDPEAGGKTTSVQLYFILRGSKAAWKYGFSVGHDREQYVKTFHVVLHDNAQAIAQYLRHAPEGTIVSIESGEENDELSPSELADRLDVDEADSITSIDASAGIDIYRQYPLDSLLDHVDGLVDEVGTFFTWAWPLFQASITGKWHVSQRDSKRPVIASESDEVDEDAPSTLEQLCETTSLSLPFLQDLQEALLAKQQVVLVGPPGTSKTYIAQQFGRYFVRQRTGQMQGVCHTLYMHANWSYEDFFEGIKPVVKDGLLQFEPTKGFFLEWVTNELKGYDPSARHVLVLDEINRCDTAAVLGEMLQLLEYRGTTIRLLSGRQFVFPRSLYVIGTMNSADRSIGRLDLALRRRFLWLNLHPQADTLRRWLGRPGNNPVVFDAATLEECNSRLAERGIPPEQHIGHALFMSQQRDSEDGSPHDIPLTAMQLKRIVKFSVMPYLEELFVSQFGQVDHKLCTDVQGALLRCVAAPNPSAPS